MAERIKIRRFIIRVIMIVLCFIILLCTGLASEISGCKNTLTNDPKQDSDRDNLDDYTERQMGLNECDPCDYNANCEACVIQPLQVKNFKFLPWGKLYVLEIKEKEYLASYSKENTAGMIDTDVDAHGMTFPTPIICRESKNPNLIKNGLLSEILIDENDIKTISSRSSLKLKEGYELFLIAYNKPKLYLELRRNGQKIGYNRVIGPEKGNATIYDTTFLYKTALLEKEKIVTIAVHFKKAMEEGDGNTAIVDGIFQISDTPISIKVSDYAIPEGVIQRLEKGLDQYL